MRTGVASRTAARVAAARLDFPRLPAPGDPAAEERLARDVAPAVTDGAAPLARYLQARTAFFDRFVVGGLDAGIPQVVVVAAGYDGRAWRYHRPGVRWFEVDHPDTQADKRARLARLGIGGEHVSFVPADLTVGGLPAALAGAGLDPAAAALVSCEGLLVYLDRPVIESLLADLRAAVGAGSRLALSVSVATDDAAALARRAQFAARVAAVGEPARTVLTAGDAQQLLRAAGWAPQQLSERAAYAGLLTAVAG